MKFKKILVILMVLVTIFCTTLSAPAYGYSGYGSSPSGTTGSSPYGTPAGGSASTSPYTTPSGSSGTSGSGTAGSTGTGMPGSGTSSGGSSGSSMPGSGTTSSSSGSGMPGSGYSGGFGSGSTGSGAASGASDDILSASIDTNGSIVLSVPNASGVDSGDLSGSISYVFQKYKKTGTAVFGICTITAILCLLWQITKLGMAGDNERSRSMAVKGILISGASIAIFGSITLVAGMFWGAFL